MKKHDSNIKKDRECGIELLRIIAMLMIVAHHFALHTWWPQVDSMTFNVYFIELLKSFGKVGAAIFFVITGYFIANSKTNKPVFKKILQIAKPVWFYSIATLIFSIIFLDYKVAISLPLDANILHSIAPILTGSYWFISEYIILSLISPHLKKMYDGLKDNELIKLLIVYLIFCWGSGIISYAISGAYAPIISIPSSILYASIGILIHRMKDEIKTKTAICIASFSTVFLAVAPFITKSLAKIGYTDTTDLFWQFNSPICIAIAVSLFIIFRRLKIKSKVINIIASSTMGVYLIHDNIFIRQLLWNSGKITDVHSHIYDGRLSFILFSITMIFVVFIVSSIIELIRIYISKVLFKRNK